MPPLTGTSSSINAAVDGQNTDGGPGVLGQTTGNSPASGVQGSSVDGRGVTGESGSAEGVLGTSQSGIGVLGASTSDNGVRGTSNSSAKDGRAGVLGNNTGGGSGVLGTSSGVGVLGRGVTGVFGESSDPNGAGVQGLNNVGPNGIAVFGTSTGGTGVKGQTFRGTGVLGESAGGTAVHGINTGNSGLAGRFDGAIEVNGLLTKTAGSFMIDHPLDPANKYLKHSFVESPDMMNVYNGIAKLDAEGKATVDLPVWFEALNQEFRYGLTSIGAPAPNLHVAREVEENRFEIAGGSSGLKVSWQLTGIRRDPHAELNRIEVEVEKPRHERGKYLHPREYGLPEAMGIHHRVISPTNVLSRVELADTVQPRVAEVGAAR